MLSPWPMRASTRLMSGLRCPGFFYAGCPLMHGFPRAFSHNTDNHSRLGTCELLPPFKVPICQKNFSRDDAHPSRRIWQLLSAIKAANITQAAIIAMRPRGTTVDAVKHIRQNPSDALHHYILVWLRRAGVSPTFRARDLSARHINSVIFLRARADCAFTVPWGTPKIRAVSRIDKPSIWRS